jgi:hypothetical protein
MHAKPKIETKIVKTGKSRSARREPAKTERKLDTPNRSGRSKRGKDDQSYREF